MGGARSRGTQPYLPVTTDFFPPRTLTDRLTFNSSNWNETREIVIFGIDDDIIRYSPYGGVLNVTASTNDNSSTLASLTLLVKDTDRGTLVLM